MARFDVASFGSGRCSLSDLMLTELKTFLELQEGLATAWLQLCEHSHDVELLLDFPTRKVVPYRGEQWEALKHGTGVAFRSNRTLVDVPYGVRFPYKVEPNRFFDYLQSERKLHLLGWQIDDDNARDTIEQLFALWLERGLLVASTDEFGRRLFELSGQPQSPTPHEQKITDPPSQPKPNDGDDTR